MPQAGQSGMFFLLSFSFASFFTLSSHISLFFVQEAVACTAMPISMALSNDLGSFMFIVLVERDDFI
jgi:hypothetical protein